MRRCTGRAAQPVSPHECGRRDPARGSEPSQGAARGPARRAVDHRRRAVRRVRRLYALGRPALEVVFRLLTEELVTVLVPVRGAHRGRCLPPAMRRRCCSARVGGRRFSRCSPASDACTSAARTVPAAPDRLRRASAGNVSPGRARARPGRRSSHRRPYGDDDAGTSSGRFNHPRPRWRARPDARWSRRLPRTSRPHVSGPLTRPARYPRTGAPASQDGDATSTAVMGTHSPTSTSYGGVSRLPRVPASRRVTGAHVPPTTGPLPRDERRLSLARTASRRPRGSRQGFRRNV